MPFSLLYKTNALMPVETAEPTFRVMHFSPASFNEAV